MLARARNSPYLNPMVQPISIPARNDRRQPSLAAGWRRRSSGVAASLGAIVSLGAVALWFHYGTAVFFEMIAAGISACF